MLFLAGLLNCSSLSFILVLVVRLISIIAILFGFPMEVYLIVVNIQGVHHHSQAVSADSGKALAGGYIEGTNVPITFGERMPKLVDFIACALYCTRLNDAIVHSVSLLLTRLKQRYPSARETPSSPHRLFLSALMLASKMSMDNTYSNKSWVVVGQNMFSPSEVNRMERKLFEFLNSNC